MHIYAFDIGVPTPKKKKTPKPRRSIKSRPAAIFMHASNAPAMGQHK